MVARLRAVLFVRATLTVCVIALCSSTAWAQNFMFMGGDVVADAQVVVVYWGKQMDDGVFQPKLDQFYLRLAGSHYFEPLAEYSTRTKRLGRVSFLRSAQILPNDTRTIDTVELAREIDRQINSGALPPATDNTIYMVHLGAKVRTVMGSNLFGVPVGAPAGPASGFCGYHFTARIQAPTPVPTVAVFGQKIRIGVVPDQALSGCLRGLDFFTRTTSSASHELIEAIVNPDSLLIEMLPISGADVQCNGARFPIAALQSSVTPFPLLPMSNGVAPWAWASSLSKLCNPEEISDNFEGAKNRCDTVFPYNTTGAPDGMYTVSGYFLNSLGRCAIAPHVAPRVVTTVDRACQAVCDKKFAVCSDNVGTSRDQARCRASQGVCKQQCVH